MQASEIKAKMSPVPWTSEKEIYGPSITSNGTNDVCDVIGKTTAPSTDFINAEAIYTAINSTYGANIDPTAIAGLVEAAEELRSQVAYLENKYNADSTATAQDSIERFNIALSALYITPKTDSNEEAE